jgi:hypothetical protein
MVGGVLSGGPMKWVGKGGCDGDGEGCVLAWVRVRCLWLCVAVDVGLCLGGTWWLWVGAWAVQWGRDGGE